MASYKESSKNEKDGKKWLKIIVICVAIVALAGILYFTLLQPAIDEHNKLIDQRVNELKYGK